MRWQFAALAAVFLLGAVFLSGNAQAAPKDAGKALESAAARDEALAQTARQRSREAQSERAAQSAAAAYAAALRAKEESRAKAASTATERALAGVGPVGGDAQGASARAALAAHANAARQRAQGQVIAIAQSEGALKQRDGEIAALIASLDGAASAFEARASAQRLAAQREIARAAQAQRDRKAALAARRTQAAKVSASGPAARAAAQPLPKSAATQRLMEGGTSIVRAFGAQQAGGPRAAGVTLVPVRAGGHVMAPLGGKVLHTGAVRHLGMVLIMDAGDGYVLVFGGLADAAFAKGAQLSKGDRIGHLPLAAESALYFEVRHNGISIDPESWPRLRS